MDHKKILGVDVIFNYLNSGSVRTHLPKYCYKWTNFDNFSKISQEVGQFGQISQNIAETMDQFYAFSKILQKNDKFGYIFQNVAKSGSGSI